ncbi:unnamed protein product [Hermetia illucens]|uniref:Hexosyltransferase n=1 Tax=Hermetia illucens TaxID=343691 RepID=A0A7R8UKD8_HERIL|nr:beta-1,3-galactosyltransferase 1-like isoform X2 [Hermetia illucens]CAD7082475.1 unnamed protein product [Hermetia illucens]
MELFPAQSRPLLADYYSNTSNEDEDEYYRSENDNSVTITKGDIAGDDIVTSNGSRRNRHQFSNRRTKRYTRCVIICGALVVILLLIYIPLFSNIQSRLVPIPGWGFNTSRTVSDYVFPDRDTTLIEPRSVCHSNFFVLIVVCSAVDNFSNRQMIRETWGNVTEFNYPLFSKIHSNLAGQYLDISELNLRMYADFLNISKESNLNESSHHRNYPVRIVFLIGKSKNNDKTGNETIARLKLESEQYDDLIQEDFLDTYHNLTIKSVMLLKWVQKRCLTRVRFVMKCDDDTFVHIPNLLHILLGGTVPIYNSTLEYFDAENVNVLASKNRLTQDKDLLMGYMFCFVKPVATVGNKWYSPLYMYSGDTYPNYLSGSSYLMSVDVIPKLFNASLHTALLHLEDVYITGICAEKIHLRRRQHPLFCFDHAHNKCTYRGIVTQHYLKGDVMRDVYSATMNLTIECAPPDKYFKVKRLKKRLKNCHY